MAEPSDNTPSKVVEGIICNYCGSKNLRKTGEIRFHRDYYDHSIFHGVVCKDCDAKLWVRRWVENDGFSNINRVPTLGLSDKDVAGCDDYRKFLCPECNRRGALSDHGNRWYTNGYVGYFCVCEMCGARYVHYDCMHTTGFETLDFEELEDFFDYESKERQKRLNKIFASLMRDS